MGNTKMTKDTVPEGFTIPLAVVDAIPVLLFCTSMIVIGSRFQSLLFILGAAMMFFAGAAKVLWKVIVVLKKKNIWWMFLQMRILMPIGMLCMIVSLIINGNRINAAALWSSLTIMPSAACFLVCLLGMILMGIFAFKLDSSDVKSNWIEQLTNSVAQAALLLGIILLK